MAQASRIEWTESTWNPVVGCRKVSEGCRNCYAERMAKRLAAIAAAAKRLRDDIADVMQGEMPPGFKDLLRKYYERLSEGEGP